MKPEYCEKWATCDEHGCSGHCDEAARDAEIVDVDVTRAAIAWCSGKECKTFLGEIAYFRGNWRAVPELREMVEAEASARIAFLPLAD